MKNFLIVCLLAISSFVFAVEDAVWEMSSSENVNWISVLPSGNLLAVGDAKVFCLNASDGAVLWENNSLIELKTEDISSIPYSNYLVIQKDTTIILDASTGKKIINSAQVGLNTVNYYSLIYDKNSLFLIGTKEEKTTIVLVDLTSGQTAWELVIESFDSEEIKYVSVLEGNRIIIADETNFLNINLDTGVVNWTYTAQGKDFQQVYLRPEEDIAFLVSGTINGTYGSCSIEAVDVKSGESLFSKIDFKGAFHKLIFSEGEVLISWGQGFNRINLTTGELDFNIKPLYGEKTTLFNRTDKGYMFVRLYGQNYSLYYFDFTGAPIVRTIKSGYFREIGLEGDNISILTTSMFGLYDGTTGKKIKEKSTMVVPDFSFIQFDETNNCYIAYSKNNLYKLDKNNYTIKNFTSNIKQYNVSGKRSMEIIESGYLIKNENEFSLIGFDGNEIYHLSFPILMSAKDFMISPPKLSFSFNDRVVAETKYTDAINKSLADRYSRKSEISNQLIIQTKITNNDVKSLGILCIDKNTGKELKKIEIMERDPVYVIDEIDNILYYKTGTNDIKSYQL